MIALNFRDARDSGAVGLRYLFMRKLVRAVRRLVRDERGTETLEGGLGCGLIVVGAIMAIGFIGPKVTLMWNTVNNKIPDAAP